MIGKVYIYGNTSNNEERNNSSFVRYRGHKILNDFITLDNALLAKAKCWI